MSSICLKSSRQSCTSKFLQDIKRLLLISRGLILWLCSLMLGNGDLLCFFTRIFPSAQSALFGMRLISIFSPNIKNLYLGRLNVNSHCLGFASKVQILITREGQNV